MYIDSFCKKSLVGPTWIVLCTSNKDRNRSLLPWLVCIFPILWIIWKNGRSKNIYNLVSVIYNLPCLFVSNCVPCLAPHVSRPMSRAPYPVPHVPCFSTLAMSIEGAILSFTSHHTFTKSTIFKFVNSPFQVIFEHLVIIKNEPVMSLERWLCDALGLDDNDRAIGGLIMVAINSTMDRRRDWWQGNPRPFRICSSYLQTCFNVINSHIQISIGWGKAERRPKLPSLGSCCFAKAVYHWAQYSRDLAT